MADGPQEEPGTRTRVPIVFTHLRTLQGIFESCNHYTPTPPTTEQRALELGIPAGRYLLAHGYTRGGIDSIIEIRQEVTTGAEFAMRLAGEGMALTEASYLWALIVHSAM